MNKADTMTIEASLAKRLRELLQKRYKNNEKYYIISEFLLSPSIAKLIEDNNKIYRVKVCKQDNGEIYSLKLQYERGKNLGFWDFIKSFFTSYITGIRIWHNGQLYLCEYYKYSFFSLCEDLKVQYDTKLKSTFGCDFVIVCRGK